MKTRLAAGAMLAIGLIALLVWVVAGYRADSAQIAVGRDVYAGNCASCHGTNLEGQPDWQTPLPSGRMPAPPHDASGHTWHHSDSELFTITKKGMAAVVPGYSSDMPSFEGVLSDDQIHAVLAFIKSTWPGRERDYQAARTSAAE